MVEKYVNGNSLSKSRVAVDVKDGKLLAKDIKALLAEIDGLVADGTLTSPYIGKKYEEKLGKAKWNKEYLERLVAVAASSECFNKDYLLYLAKVSKYVRSRGMRILRIIILLFIAFVLGFIVDTSKDSKELKNLKGETIPQLKSDKKTLEKERDELSEQLSQYSDYDTIKMQRDNLQKERNELLELPLVKILIKKALSGKDAKTVNQEYEKSNLGREDVRNAALEMQLSRKQMKQVCEALNLPEEKMGLDDFPAE